MNRSSAAAPWAAAIGLVLAAPLIVVVLVGGGSGTPALASTGGFGRGIRRGTVPAKYVTLVNEAGSLCVAAPPAIIAAQIDQESSWNPSAVSAAGAEGISQFLPSTWSHWAEPPSASPFDASAAIPAQGRYDCAIASQIVLWQSQGRLATTLDVTSLMLAGYNAGPYAVLDTGGIPDNGQTPDYVARIMSLAAHFADTTGGGVVAPAGSFAAKEIAAARAEIGLPYVFAAGSYAGPTSGGFDCSGLVMFAVFQASDGAIKLPHLADLQTRPGYGGALVDRTQLQPGDLIGFTYPGESAAHHVGIYLGNSQMLDAPSTGELVRIEDLTSSYYQSQSWRVIRYQ